MNTKNSTKRQLCCRLVEFLVFNSIHRLISVPCDEVYRVRDGGPDHAIAPQLFIQELSLVFYCDYEQTKAIRINSERSAFYERFEDSEQLDYLSGTIKTLGFASTPTGKTCTIS